MESFLAGVWPRPVRDDTAGRTEAKCVCVCVGVCVRVWFQQCCIIWRFCSNGFRVEQAPKL